MDRYCIDPGNYRAFLVRLQTLLVMSKGQRIVMHVIKKSESTLPMIKAYIDGSQWERQSYAVKASNHASDCIDVEVYFYSFDWLEKFLAWLRSNSFTFYNPL